MSQVYQPAEREPVEIDGRRMTPARRARIIARDGCCRYPGCEVAEGLEVDHIVALELGGRDRDDNLQALCGPHHRQKTAIDAGLIAKAKRRKAKNDGTFPPSKARLRGRGFQKTRAEIS
jgi:5-methylcytosine-specific restriction enzyme A